MITETNPMELLLQAITGDIKEKITKRLDERIDDAIIEVENKVARIKDSLSSTESYVASMVEGKPLVVTLPSAKKPEGEKELVHSQFNKVLKILTSAKRKEKNIMLVGEAGSGKTHLCGSVAKALGLEFYPMSVGLQTTKSDLLGFVNAQGNYVTTPVREAYEKGGLLLLDEFDAAHAGVVTILNSLLANGHCSFADKIVTKHPNFVCICACNTYGKGATVDYIGRNRLDAATLDRFIVVDVGYDTKLEKALASNDGWATVINKIRKNIAREGIKMVVSPRATMDGADLLDQGFKPDEVLDMVVFKGVAKDVKAKALKGIDISTELLLPTLKEEPMAKKSETPSLPGDPGTMRELYSPINTVAKVLVKYEATTNKYSLEVKEYDSLNKRGSVCIGGKDNCQGSWFSWGSKFSLGIGGGFYPIITPCNEIFLPAPGTGPKGQQILLLDSGIAIHLQNSIKKWKGTVRANVTTDDDIKTAEASGSEYNSFAVEITFEGKEGERATYLLAGNRRKE